MWIVRESEEQVCIHLDDIFLSVF